MKRCIRCGDEIERWLRCDYCRELVDEDIRWEKERPREFYNKRHKQNATIRNTTGEKQSAKEIHWWRSAWRTTRHSFLSQRQGEFQI